jgi:hypothetical protein
MKTVNCVCGALICFENVACVDCERGENGLAFLYRKEQKKAAATPELRRSAGPRPRGRAGVTDFWFGAVGQASAYTVELRSMNAKIRMMIRRSPRPPLG